MTGNVGAPCRVCAHPQRREIDAALVGAESNITGLSRTHGLSRQSLMRHRDNHLAKAIRDAVARENASAEVAHADSLLGEVKNLQQKVEALGAAAYRGGDLRGAIAALTSAAKMVETRARLSGNLREGGTTINIHASVEFRSFTVDLLRVLDRHPDAKREVLQLVGGPVIEGD